MTTQAYLEQFQNVINVIEHSGGTIGHEPGIKKMIAHASGVDVGDIDDMSTDERDDLHKNTHSRYLAVAFKLVSDRSRFGRLIEKIKNDYLQGQNNYPITVTAAYNLLTNWKQDPQNFMQAIGPINNGVSFANVNGNEDEDNAVTLPNNGQKKGQQRHGEHHDKSHITCHRCGKKGTMPMNVRRNVRLAQPCLWMELRKENSTALIISSSYSMNLEPPSSLVLVGHPQDMDSA